MVPKKKKKRVKIRHSQPIRLFQFKRERETVNDLKTRIKRERGIRLFFISSFHGFHFSERERERERVREKKGEKYLEADWPSTRTAEMVRPF